MNKPKVSLLMPVYNSFSYERSDGKVLLPLALNSLLQQTFTDFELIILDNQSTDDTAKICNEYAAKDKRVRYVLDTKKRFAEEAITHLASMATAPYSMIVNDDDLWARDYIEKAVAHLDSHPKTDLIQGAAIFIHTNHYVIGKYAPPKTEIYPASMDPVTRFLRYVKHRNVIPINFGLFRTEAWQRILPYQDFDTLKSNVDNALMLKFFMLGYSADYDPSLLFFYRRKTRRLNPKVFASNMPALEYPVGIWFFYIHHQLLFYKRICTMVEGSTFSKNNTEFIKVASFLRCLEQSLMLLLWLTNEFKDQKKPVQEKICAQLYAKYKHELEKTFADLPDPEIYILNRNHVITPEDIARWQAKAVEIIPLVQHFIADALKLEDVSDTSFFAQKVNGILDGVSIEMKAAIRTATAGAPSQPLPLVAEGRPIEFGVSIRRFLNEHRVVKSLFVFIHAIYLNVRYLPMTLYTRKNSHVEK